MRSFGPVGFMHLQNQSQLVTNLMSARLLRDVFGSDPARDLLLLLAHEERPIRYSEARRRLQVHPQAFQRALETLEEYALLGLRVDPAAPPVSTRQPVLLEATGSARFLADVWGRWSRQYEAAARDHADAAQALALLGR